MAPSPSPVRSFERYRILHVLRTPVGGLFRHVTDLARLQAAAGHGVGIVCDATTGGLRAEQRLADLAPHLSLGVTRLPMGRRPGLADIATLTAIGRVAQRVRASVLHGHGAKGGVFARLASGAADAPAPIRAYTPHGGSYHYPQGSLAHRFFMGVEGVLARRTDLFLFESAYVADLHRRDVGACGSRARLVHNGLAPDEFAPVAPAPERFDLVYIGEMRALKGIAYLFEALAALARAGRPLRLLAVGAGPDEAALRAQAAALGLAVRFEPPQPIRAVLARARVMVVPSLLESLPYVVLEAAAAGHPLVATRAGGIPEIFDAQAERLVPTHDAPALAAGIVRILDKTPAERAAQAAALRASVQARFCLDAMGEDVLGAYAAAFRARARAEGAIQAPAGEHESVTMPAEAHPR